MAQTPLKSVLARYQWMEFLRRTSMDRVRQNNKNAFNDRFFECFDLAGEKLSTKRLEELSDSLSDGLKYQCVLELVATFEKQIFEKVGNATGHFRNVLNRAPVENVAFEDFSDRFVLDSERLSNLRGIHGLLKDKHKLSDALDEIISYRNWIAHGFRGIGVPSSLSVEDIEQRLSGILSSLTH